MGLYDRIKAVCAEKGMSVAQLERELGYVKGKIGKMNDSSPSVETASAISDRLGVSLDYLVNGVLIERTKPKNNEDVLLAYWEKLSAIDQARILVAMDDAVHKNEGA